MNKKRHILFGITPGPPLKAGGHLSDDWLLLAIDGELSTSDYALVKEHVRACWTCRARKEHLERTIEEIVEYEQALVAPDMPPSPGGKAIFTARLDQLAAELGSPSLVRRWSLTLLQAFRLAFSPRVTWVAAAALAIVACLYVVFQRNAPTVSASELLQRAATSESGSLAGINQPVVVQKLGIKVNGHKMTRTIYRDRERNRQASRIDVSASEELFAESVFHQTWFSWDEPLSPQKYSHWREGLSEKRESVTQPSGDLLLKLDTTTSSGLVAEASLTVRSDDYHPVAEDLRLQDNTHIEIAELSYEVVGLSSLNPDIFGGPTPTEPLRLPTTSASLPIRAALPDAAQVALSELQAQTALHGIGADLGEQITVEQGTDGLVQVDGVAENDARKQQIAAALMGIPFTELRVKTIAQAAAYPRPGHALPNANPTSPATIAAATPPLLEEQLKQRFPDTDQRTEYVNQSLALCQSASARAWALNRLADHYTPEQIALLDHGTQQQLQRLLADHIAALREDVSRLQNQLGQVLSSSSNTAAANTPFGGYATADSPGTQPLSDDWRNRVHRVHSSVETTNEAVAVLLTGSSENDTSPDKLQLRLRTTLTQLQAELQLLDQQVHKQL